jgi:hypothetical protein
MAHLANRMRSLAANGNQRAEELIEKADELDKMIDADTWDTEQVLGAWLRARKLWCEVTGVFVGRHDGKRRKLKAPAGR